MTRRFTCLIMACFLSFHVHSQGHWGAGEDTDITVTSSDSWDRTGWTQTANGQRTIDGQGLDARYLETSRFLGQATLGVPRHVIGQAAEMEFEEWLDEQFAIPQTPMLQHLDDTWQEVFDHHLGRGIDSSEIYGPSWVQFNYAWWTANSISEDYLRHRLALALSEIFVVSINTDLSGMGRGLASYYDALYTNAFGNYRDILEDVTLHMCMGFYLSHLNNPKADPANNIRPDENYAREVMQLFSIGLFELNNDGTKKLDGQGNPIPTYGQKEISEFAKVFTGLGPSKIVENPWIDSAQFDLGIYVADMTEPMAMYEDWHQQGQKELLNGFVVPSGQSGMQDVQDALDNLYNHPNVGPFIGRLLIQRLVKSNPTAGYIDRVAQAFNDDGNGVRGNMQAVIKAILLDEEARTCAALTEPEAARLRPPLVRYTHFAGAMDKEQIYGRFWNVNYGFHDATGMSPLWAPSVFNFYLPDFQPQGEIADQDLVAPEYQIHNTKLSVGFMNQANGWTIYNNLMSGWEGDNPDVSINVDHFKQFANDPEVLLNELDKVFTHGFLTDRTREIIKEAISNLIWNDYKEERVRLAMYLLLVSPDYAVMR